MIGTDDGRIYAWNMSATDDPHCEGCGRSIVARFGGNTPQKCDSCSHEWRALGLDSRDTRPEGDR